MGLFTLAQARIELAGLRPLLDELVVVRADVVELAAALTTGGEPTDLGGLPELKAAEARLNELMTEVQQTGGPSSRASLRCSSTFPPISTACRCCCAGWRARTP
nr:hypothetical protein GCM10020092_081860 [Actinoplanes digitatis]